MSYVVFKDVPLEAFAECYPRFNIPLHWLRPLMTRRGYRRLRARLRAQRRAGL